MLKIRPEDHYIIRHTGGTTGRSKGVAYTHKAWLACNRDWFYNYPPVEPGDKCLHVGPISHGSGYLFVPIWVWGGCNVMVDRFEPAEVVEIMETGRHRLPVRGADHGQRAEPRADRATPRLVAG